MKEIDDLQNYRRGRLSAAAQRAFEQRLETDAELRAELRQHENMQRAIGLGERASLKAELQGLEAELVKPAKVVSLRRNRLRVWLAAASVVLLLLAGGWLFREFNTATTPADLYATYYAPYPNVLDPIVRGEDDLTPRQRALASYEQGDYPQAAAQLAALPDANLDTQFYQALSLLSSDRTGEAIALLDQLAKSPSERRAQIRWYLALGYLRAENVEAARETLEVLQASGSDYKAAEVADLLGELGK